MSDIIIKKMDIDEDFSYFDNIEYVTSKKIAEYCTLTNQEITQRLNHHVEYFVNDSMPLLNFNNKIKELQNASKEFKFTNLTEEKGDIYWLTENETEKMNKVAEILKNFVNLEYEPESSTGELLLDENTLDDLEIALMMSLGEPSNHQQPDT